MHHSKEITQQYYEELKHISNYHALTANICQKCLQKVIKADQNIF